MRACCYHAKAQNRLSTVTVTMSMYSWLILCLLTVSSTATVLYEQTVNGLTFEEVHTTTFSNNTLGVFDMDIDRYLPGNILYITDHALWTMNIHTREAHILVHGMNTPRSLIQMNETLILVTESNSHCIKAVSRTSNLSTTLAGDCGYKLSYVDGSFGNTRFGAVFGTARLSDHSIAVADSDNFCIRSLDLEMEEVSTILTLAHKPWGLEMQREKLFFSTDSDQIGFLDMITDQVQYINSQVEGREPNDGSLSSVVFGGFVFTITFLTEDILMVADQSDTIRIIDLAEDRVTSLCQAVTDQQLACPGNASECKVYKPQSFLVLPEENKILVGFDNTIGHIELSSGSKCAGFLCGDRECISYHRVCDGFYDCDSGEDESDCLFSYYPSSTGIDSTTESMIGTDPTTEDYFPENSGRYIGIAVGTVVGGAVFLIVIIVLCCVVIRIHRRNKNLNQNVSSAAYTSTQHTAAISTTGTDQPDDHIYDYIDPNVYADNIGYMVPIQSRPQSAVSGPNSTATNQLYSGSIGYVKPVM